MKFFVEHALDMIDMEFRVFVIPTEHAECRQFSGSSVFGEVGKRDFPVFAFTVGRDKEQVMQFPGCPLRLIRRMSFPKH